MLSILVTPGDNNFVVETMGALSGSGMLSASTNYSWFNGGSPVSMLVGANNGTGNFTGQLVGYINADASRVTKLNFTKVGTGTQIFNGVTYNGSTSLTNVNFVANNGTLELDNIILPTPLVLGGPLASPTTQGNAAVADAQTLTMNANILYQAIANPGPSAITGTGTIAFGATARTFTVENSSSVLPTDPELTVATSISGTAGWTKDGGGMLLLNGNNTYTGTTTVSRGIVRVSSGHAIPDDGNVNLTNAVSAGLEVADTQNETIGSLIGGSTLGGFVRLLGTGQLTVGADNTNQTFSGLLMGGSRGNVGFVKSGTGNLTLNITAGGQVNSAAPMSGQLSSYVGDIAITGSGKLILGAAYALPLSSTVTIGSAATFDLGNITDPVMGSLSGTGTVTNTGANARNPFIGADGASQTFNGRFAGGANFGIVKIGTGVQTLNNLAGTGTNIATANLYVHNGTLALAGSGTTDPVNLGLTNGIYVRGNSMLLIDNTDGATNRINDARTIILGGGTVWFKPNASTNTVETLTSLSWEHGGGIVGLEASDNYSSVLSLTTVPAYGSGDWWHPILVEGTGLGTAAPGARRDQPPGHHAQPLEQFPARNGRRDQRHWQHVRHQLPHLLGYGHYRSGLPADDEQRPGGGRCGDQRRYGR